MWVIRDLTTAWQKGKLASPDQTRLRRRDRPASVRTSISPPFAFGARSWLNERLRKSQSTRITRAPPWAQICAKDAETVDLPSSGNDDVMPITLFDLAPPAKVGTHLYGAY